MLLVCGPHCDPLTLLHHPVLPPYWTILTRIQTYTSVSHSDKTSPTQFLHTQNFSKELFPHSPAFSAFSPIPTPILSWFGSWLSSWQIEWKLLCTSFKFSLYFKIMCDPSKVLVENPRCLPWYWTRVPHQLPRSRQLLQPLSSCSPLPLPPPSSLPPPPSPTAPLTLLSLSYTCIVQGSAKDLRAV